MGSESRLGAPQVFSRLVEETLAPTAFPTPYGRKVGLYAQNLKEFMAGRITKDELAERQLDVYYNVDPKGQDPAVADLIAQNIQVERAQQEAVERRRSMRGEVPAP